MRVFFFQVILIMKTLAAGMILMMLGVAVGISMILAKMIGCSFHQNILIAAHMLLFKNLGITKIEAKRIFTCQM